MFSTRGGRQWLLLFVIAVAMAIAAPFATRYLMHEAQGEVPVIVNGVVLGVKNADGSITQKPPFCGPNAHVENVPGYGELCVQAARWGAGSQDHVAVCATQNQNDSAGGRPLNSCQSGIGWMAQK